MTNFHTKVQSNLSWCSETIIEKPWALTKPFWFAQWFYISFPSCKMGTEICVFQLLLLYLFLVSVCRLPTVAMSISKQDTHRSQNCQKLCDENNITCLSKVTQLALMPSSASVQLQKTYRCNRNMGFTITDWLGDASSAGWMLWWRHNITLIN